MTSTVSIILPNSNNKFEPAQCQLEKTAYRPTRRAFIIALEILKQDPDTYRKVEILYVSTWTIHVEPDAVFGRLASKLEESLNMLMKLIGMKFCSLLK